MKMMFHISSYCRPFFRRIVPTTASSSSRYRLHTKSSTTIISDYTPYLSEVSLARHPSAIRKLIPLTKQPGMVSLGGGIDEIAVDMGVYPDNFMNAFKKMNLGLNLRRIGSVTLSHSRSANLSAMTLCRQSI